MTKRNFKLIWWFWIAEKEIKQRKIKPNEIIDKYYNIWIREFFIWYNPPYWHEKYWFELSPNWRFWENEQITSYETFCEAINYVHSLKTESWSSCEIFMATNARYYSDITMPLIKKILDEGIKAWIDGIIVWSPEILEYLAEIWFKGKINLSTILSLYNEDAIQFFIEYFKEKWLNLNRLILPREMTLKEIKSLCEKFPKNSFEVFGHGDYCRYANGLCLAEHKYFSRDICGFVLKHWLDIKKAIRYDFKTLILNHNITDQEKQDMIDNEIKDLEDIFVTQNVVWSNYKNNILDEYIIKFQNDFYWELDSDWIKEIAEKIYLIMKKDIKLNFFKYIYDWLRSYKYLHNEYIDKFLTLYSMILHYINSDKSIEEQISHIKKCRIDAIKYYTEQINKKWKFWLETYYKFMLYNRTSVPFYKFFNEIPNIDIIKIPLRWRDAKVFWLWLDLIDSAIEDPWKFIDSGNLNWKYFHYDPVHLNEYKEKINKLKTQCW